MTVRADRRASSGVGRVEREYQEVGRQSSRLLRSILPRVSGNSRMLRLSHLFRLAQSISALGLLEPLVIDEKNRLLAGGHRLAACLLLACPPGERARMLEQLQVKGSLSSDEREALSELKLGELDPTAVPVRVMGFDSKTDADRALAIEAAENQIRKDYSPAEVRELYSQLLAKGYTDRRGRPRKGEKAIRPALAAVVGKSERHVRRLLEQAKNRTSAGFSSPIQVRLEGDLADQLRAMSSKTGRSVVELVNEILKKTLGAGGKE